MRLKLIAIATAALSLALAGQAQARTDYAGQAFNILAPGQYGGVPTTANSTDQLKLYDALTPLQGHVGPSDLSRYFKSEHFGVSGSVVRTEHPRADVQILRDSFDVPHIYGRTRAGVMFASGWVAAEDRGLLLQEARGPAYLAAVDAPGINAFGLVTSLRSFTPSAQAQSFVARQRGVLDHAGAKGRQVLGDIDDWVAGINAYYAATTPAGSRPTPFTRTDAIAAFAFIGSIFGNGGGNEVANSQFLASLRARLGTSRGTHVFRDLREAQDPESPTTTSDSFPYEPVPHGPTPGSLVIDRNSQSASAAQAAAAGRSSHKLISNFLVVGANRSADHHPMAVMGPQLGYYYPEIVMEEDMHGGGIDVRGAVPPVSPYVLIGRGKDFAWSLTSASNDNTDQFLEQLCNPDGSRATRSSTHYLYKGRCRAMSSFDAGRIGASSTEPAHEVVFNQTVHGPVSGTVTVHGRPYAIARDRANRGREPAGELALSDLNSNRVDSPQSFFHAVNQFETTFNWPYIDSRHIGYFSSGRLPVRAPGTDPSLPTLGTGRYDWRGFLSFSQHPHQIDPANSVFLNWNNRPARNWGAADDNYDWGSVHRVQLFTGFRHRMRLSDVVSIMNRAATEDLRTVQLWPLIRAMLDRTRAPDPRAAQAAALIDAWRRHGSDRLDRNLDGKIDDPGAAVMDAAFDRLAVANLRPVLGSLTGELSDIQSPSGDPSPGGSSFGGGWYSYMSKDLRTELGRPVAGRFSTRYCGAGNVDACSRSLWAAIDAAAAQLAAQQGPNPSAWRADATAERIKFQPGILPDTMRWTNRPTFQQAIEFSAHRAAAAPPSQHRPARRHGAGFTG